MSSSVIHIANKHPLKVRDLLIKFEVSAYTIRQWAKSDRVSGAKKIGRAWCFSADVDYVKEEAAAPPSQADAVRKSLELLSGYQVGVPRAA